jgi:hypothetical protein
LWQLCQIASVAAAALVASQDTTRGVVDALINDEGIPKGGRGDGDSEVREADGRAGRQAGRYAYKGGQGEYRVYNSLITLHGI